jgi:glycosyltransferase involved in cell wall biosynthesis
VTRSDETLRILYATPGYKPAYRLGGPVVSVAAVAERLVRRGHRVTVFATNSNLDEELDVPLDRPVDVDGVEVWYFERKEPLQRLLPGVRYLSQSMGYLYAPAMAAALARSTSRMDVVHTHLPFVYPTLAAGRAALRSGRPLIYHQRGVFDRERLRFRGAKKRLYLRLFERPLMRRAALLIALTEAEVASYRALGLETPCAVVPNGVEVDAYRWTPTADVSSRWGIGETARVILFMGRVHPVKGADRLVEAFCRIAGDVPGAVLVMAGPDEFGLAEGFRVRVGALGLQDRVLFTGMVQGGDKLDLLARADVFCLPSDAEGFSIAVLEALASGTAVLLSPGCHFPQVVSDRCGEVVTPESGAIAAALLRMLANPAELRAMGERGRRLVSERYSWETVVDRMVDLYRGVCEGRAAAPSGSV